MTWSSTYLRRTIIAIIFLGCLGLMTLLGGSERQVAASPMLLNFTPSATVTGTPPTATSTRTPTNTRTPTSTRTPLPTPGPCGDWRHFPAPVGNGLTNTLRDVDAVSANDVWAVGDQGSAYESLVQHWDGQSWQIIPSPNPMTLRGVAAIASDDVWAVGFPDSYGVTTTIHWDGTAWSVVPSPNVPGVPNYLYAVSASGPNDVWAVGKANSRPLFLHWDGTAWSIVPTPDGVYGSLNAVSALAPDDAWAVGTVGVTYGDDFTVTLHWDGTSWTRVDSPSPGTYHNILYGVTMIATDDVWAVGTLANGPVDYHGLIMHWDGSAWEVSPSPGLGDDEGQRTKGGRRGTGEVPDTYGIYFHAVDAASTNEVWAVGRDYISSDTSSVIVRWDGNSWTESPHPDPSRSINRLWGVAAVAPGEAWAVGTYWEDDTSYYRALIEHYGPECGTPTPTVTGTPPTATSTRTPLPQSATPTAVGCAGGNLLTESFTVAPPAGWPTQNNSHPAGTGGGWSQGDSTTFSAHSGAPNSYAAANFNSGLGIATISNWMLTPHVALANGNIFTFWTRTVAASEYPDRLQVRLSTAGASTNVGTSATSVGDFTTLLLDINPSYSFNGYPSVWTQYTITLSGIPAGATGRIAFRYFVEDGGPDGSNSDYIGIDTITYTGSGGCPTITPTVILPTATGTAALPTASGTPAEGTSTAVSATSTPALPTATTCPGLVVNGSLTLNDPTQAGRLNTLLEASTCDNPRGCPGAIDNTVPRHYDAYAFVNTSNSTACFTVDIAAACLDEILIHSSVYLDSFDPQNLCENYLADVGPGVLTMSQYSFNVPAGARFVVVVNELAPNLLCPNYTLRVTGPACPVPSTPVPTSTSILPTLTVTVTPLATFEACTVQFSDVAPGDAFYGPVMCLTCMNLIGGYSDGTFRPYNQVTRGQLAKLVSNAAGFNDTNMLDQQTFEDVPIGSTFHMYVERVASRGIISGYPCGGEGEACGPESKPYFRPGANATRGQISKIVSNAARMSDVPASQTFEDVPPDSTFYLWIERLAMHGMMGGYPCGGPDEPCGPDNKPYFRWANDATRGQTSKIVAHTFYPGCQP
ncbi:MAG TPA: choice-of-anchor J domain-containing protein [Chloroflexia bacterium]|nr:choice-of-anchor J domain-containing protein [Chloroflexia bacterium]